MGRTGGLSHNVGGGGGELVYVVHPLPETLLDYVWDYGTLNEGEETRYIKSMLLKAFGDMEGAGDVLAAALPPSSCLPPKALRGTPPASNHA